eukprot:2901402-Pyramimonas_sp.AAC.1
MVHRPAAPRFPLRPAGPLLQFPRWQTPRPLVANRVRLCCGREVAHEVQSAPSSVKGPRRAPRPRPWPAPSRRGQPARP